MRSHMQILMNFLNNILIVSSHIMTFSGIYRPTGSLFNCSASLSPISSTVDFLIEDSTIDSIKLYDKMCFKTRTLKNVSCSPNECQCSEDGKNFFWNYARDTGYVSVSCKAKFAENCFANVTLAFSSSEQSWSPLSTKFSCTTSDACAIQGSKATEMALLLFVIMMY